MGNFSHFNRFIYDYGPGMGKKFRHPPERGAIYPADSPAQISPITGSPRPFQARGFAAMPPCASVEIPGCACPLFFNPVNPVNPVKICFLRVPPPRLRVSA